MKKNELNLLKLSKFVVLSGNSEWEEVKPTGTGDVEKWDMKTNQEFIGLLGSSFSGSSDFGEWNAYNVLHMQGGKPMGKYAIFTSKVLADKLKDIPLGSMVKITHLGKPQGKRYYDYSVAINRTLAPNPNWEQEYGMEEIPSESFSSNAQKQSSPVSTPSNNQNNQGMSMPQNIGEDLPDAPF